MDFPVTFRAFLNRSTFEDLGRGAKGGYKLAMAIYVSTGKMLRSHGVYRGSHG